MREIVIMLTTAHLSALFFGAEIPSRLEREILSRGAALEESGEYGQAKGVYLDGLRQLPRSGEIAFRVGAAFLRESNWAEAIRHLQQAGEMRPRHIDTLYYLAQAYYLDGQHALARDTIHRAATLAPDRADVAQKYGEYLCEYKVCQEGLRYLLKAQRLDPALPNIDFDLGMAHHRLASLNEARQHLEVALKKDPDNLVAARFLADVLHRGTEWERAKELYEYVLAREPKNAWAHYGRGRALIALEKYEEALEPLRQSLAINPTIDEAHFQLSRALRRLGNEDEARREQELFRALREREKRSAPVVKTDRTPFESRIWQECLRLLNEDNEAEALAYLESLLKDKQHNTHYLLGTLYFNLKRNADAARMLVRAAALSPEDADVLAFLGRAYVAQGALDRAEEVLERARALKPDGELPLIGAGELEYARQRWDQAIRYFEQSKTTQVPALLKLCSCYVLVNNHAKAKETAALVRAFGQGDAASLRELDSILASDKRLAEPAKAHP